MGEIFIYLFELFHSEYLAAGAVDPVNVDSRVADIVRRRLQPPIDRYCLDEAEVLYSVSYVLSHNNGLVGL